MGIGHRGDKTNSRNFEFIPKMETKMVKGTFQVSESSLESVQDFINGLGGQIFVERTLKFEDLGLAEIDKNQVQCLVCSRIYTGKPSDAKGNAIKHFKKSHLEKNPLETQKVQCPRCPEEVPKSNMNVHMDQKHEVKKFDQLMKRSFQPGQPQPGTSGMPPKQTAKRAKKTIKTELEVDPLTATEDDFNNNMVKIEKKELEVDPHTATEDTSWR